eukprot:CAMPEP_0185844064 /NCGR_PEP_ID=MMETSP1354-20130828/370_1 /TAXON_ID=708628 /ORGANISM="Erythrolobus madagascarensis, Strain CCMP3276" /LENGTH=598 /DNA_ID=CAMNT_0028543673 /DNA_START=50 /DNA_END=1846 /DNA_ORIENTATION=-
MAGGSVAVDRVELSKSSGVKGFARRKTPRARMEYLRMGRTKSNPLPVPEPSKVIEDALNKAAVADDLRSLGDEAATAELNDVAHTLLVDSLADDLRDSSKISSVENSQPQLPDAKVGEKQVLSGFQEMLFATNVGETANLEDQKHVREVNGSASDVPENYMPTTPGAEPEIRKLSRNGSATKMEHSMKGVKFSNVEEYNAELRDMHDSVLNPTARALGRELSESSTPQLRSNTAPTGSHSHRALLSPGQKVARVLRSDLSKNADSSKQNSRANSRTGSGEIPDFDALDTPKLSQRLFRYPSSTVSRASKNRDVEFSIKRLDNETLADRQQSMLNHIAREPVIVRTPLGQGPAKDIVSLLHNTLRLEVKDLYRILESMSVRSQDLTVRDFSGLFEWWWLFKRLALQVLIAEEEVIFRYIEATSHIQQDTMKPAQREADRRVLVLLMGRVDELGDQYISGLIGVEEQDLFRKLEAIAMALLDYMQKMDVAIPPMLMEIPKFGAKEKLAMERRTLKALVRSPTQEALYFLMRGNGLNPSAWPSGRISRMRQVSSNLKRKRYYAHLGIVQDFNERLAAYQRMLIETIPLTTPHEVLDRNMTA